MRANPTVTRLDTVQVGSIAGSRTSYWSLAFFDSKVKGSTIACTLSSGTVTFGQGAYIQNVAGNTVFLKFDAEL